MGIFQNLVVDALARHFPRLRESLRVNLLRGRLHLEDVDVAPSFLILNNMPLQINNGKIGSLVIQVPWTKLYSSPIRAQADDFRLSLSEVPFPASQRAVFDAFASELENEKKRQLAEGERGKSPLSRILTRILPMLLDRFEFDIKNVTVELKFASGEIGIFRVNELSTKPTPQAANRGDLDKLVVASGLSFTISSEAKRPALSLSETFVSFSAKFRGGAWDIDLNVPNFELQVDYCFPQFLNSLIARSSNWRIAHLYQRPNEAVTDNPRAWFQYIVRRVNSAFCKRRIYFSEDTVRRKARSFVKYKELHVKRLRRITNTNESNEILELERSLGADAILIIRDQARKHALADEVSSFATRDWLGWALLGTEVSQEQEQVAEELKHSLTVAKFRQGSSASHEISELSMIWSKIRLRINISFFRITIRDEFSFLSFRLKAAVLHAELDASLESYNGSLCIESAKLLDGEKHLWIGEPNDEVNRRFMFEEQKLPFLELKVYKLGYENKVTRELVVQSSRAELDFSTDEGLERIRQIAVFAKSMQFVSSSAIGEKSELLGPSTVMTHVAENVIQVKTNVDVTRFTLFVRSAVQNSGISFSICCSLSDFNAEVDKGDIEKTLQRGKLELSGRQHSSLTKACKETTIARYSEWSEKPKIFEVTAPVRIETGENRMDMDVISGDGFLELYSTTSFVNSLLCTRRQFLLKVLPELKNGFQNETLAKRRNHTHKNITYVLRAPSVDFKLRDSDEDNDSTEAARLKLRGVMYETEGWRYHMLRAQHIEIRESLHHDSIILAGSEIAIDADKHEGHGISLQRMDSEIENVTLSMSVQGLSKISYIVERICDNLKIPLRNVVAIHVQQRSDQISLQYDIRPTGSYSFQIKRAILRCAGYDVRIQSTLENVNLSHQDNTLTGSLESIEIKDTSDMSSRYKIVLKCSVPVKDTSPPQRVVSFVASSRTSNVQVSALQVVWLKSVISSVSRIYESFNDTWRNIRASLVTLGLVEGTSEHQTTSSGPLTVQGWDLTLIFPLSKTSDEAVCVRSSHITATLSPKGQVVSMRRGQVLTRKDSSQAQFLMHRSRKDRLSQWVVLVREIDTDISHHNDVKKLPSEHKRRVQDKWSIEILRRVSLLISPSQIQILQRFISNTFGIDKSVEKAGKPDGAYTSEDRSELEHTVSLEEQSLECETHHISADLLEEVTTSTTTPTSIANVNFDPSQLTWKRSSKYVGTQCETDVISWRLTSASIGLEDHSINDPGIRRMILHTRQDVEDSRSFNEIGTRVQAPKTAFCIEALERTDLETRTTSSCTVSLQRAQVVLCPAVFLTLKNFWEQCFTNALPKVFENGEQFQIRGREHRMGARSIDEGEIGTTFVNAHFPANHAENEFLRTPAMKTTLSLHDTSVLLLGSIDGGRKPFVKIEMESIRATILSNKDGLLVEGSRLRVKDVSVTLLRYSKRPQSSDSQRRTSFSKHLSGHSSVSERTGYGTTEEYYVSPNASQFSKSSFPPRQQSEHPPNVIGGTSLEATETFLHLKSVNVKLPSFEQNRALFTVPDVAIDCPLQSLIYFALLCPDLEVIPPLQTSAEDTQNSEALLLPDIEVTIGSVSLRTRIETTAALLSENETVRNHATVRLNGHGNILITGSFTRWDVHVKIAGDVVDEERGICDPILSPSALFLEADIMEEKCMKIEAEHFIRIALSPLTVRAVAGIAFTTAEVMEKYKKRIVETQSPPSDENGALSGMGVHLLIPGFVIRCFAEQPRTQLLRLVFRGVKCSVSFPAVINDEGKAEISLRDVILEDTVSSYLQESGVRASHAQTSHTIVSGAKDKTSTYQSPLLVSEIDSVSDSTLQRQNHLQTNQRGSWESKPVFYCLLSWYPPFEQVSAHIGGTGLDINVNLGMLSTFAEWLATLAHEYAAVQRAQYRRYRSNTRSSIPASTSSFPLGIDHIVVEPLRISVAISAPPRNLQRSLLQRALAWVMSAESADGIKILLPRVVFTGDFSSTQQFLETFTSSYARALLSRHILKQIVFQSPQIARLGRVLATSWVRRRSHVALIAGKGSSVEREGPTPAATKGIGLVGALTRVQYGLATHIREVHDVPSSEDDGLQRSSHIQQSPVDTQVIQTIDITDTTRHIRTDDEKQDGKSLFLWLRANDHRIPRNERFENSFSFSPTVSMLMTSRFLLFVNRSKRAIQEPIVTRLNIAEYHVTGPRITIVTVSSDSVSPARFAARQRERDSPSLARYLRASPRISQIQMHEIECTSPQYASWLLQQLPPQNDTLRSLLYRSR